MPKKKVKHPNTGEEHEVDDDSPQQDDATNVEKQLKERSPEKEQLDSAADQRSATGGQSGFGSAVPAKLAEEHGVDEDDNPDIPKTKAEHDKLDKKKKPE